MVYCSTTQISVFHWRKLRQDVQEGTEEAMKECFCSLSCFSDLLNLLQIAPRANIPEVAVPSYISLQSRKCTTGLPTDQGEGVHFLSWDSLFPNDCIKLVSCWHETSQHRVSVSFSGLLNNLKHARLLKSSGMHSGSCGGSKADMVMPLQSRGSMGRACPFSMGF